MPTTAKRAVDNVPVLFDRSPVPKGTRQARGGRPKSRLCRPIRKGHGPVGSWKSVPFNRDALMSPRRNALVPPSLAASTMLALLVASTACLAQDRPPAAKPPPVPSFATLPHTPLASRQRIPSAVSTGIAPRHSLRSGYGWRRDPITGEEGKFHSGQDYAAPSGTPIPAAAPGEIVYSGFNGNFGNTVIVKNAAGYSLYAHMQDGSPMPRLGQRVWPGDVIGNVRAAEAVRDRPGDATYGRA